MITPTDAGLPSAPTTTTRTCIKNLPPSFDETKLKRHLQSARPSLKITDCRLLKTKDGKSRKIAFVGFQSSDQAESAVSYFDRSFAGTARLSVSLAFAKKKGPPSTGEYRPWSKHSVGSSRYEKLQQQHQEQKGSIEKNSKSKNEEEESNNDDGVSEEVKRKRKEFLSAMGISASPKQGKDKKVSKSKFWANDDADVEPGTEPSKSNPPGPVENSKSESDDDDSDSSSSCPGSESEDDATNTEKKKGGKENACSDLDFMRSKQVKDDILTDDESEDDSSSSSSESHDSSSDSGSDSSEDEDDTNEKKGGHNTQTSEVSAIAKSSSDLGEKKETPNTQPDNTLIDRLFVRNLPFTTAEEDLFEAFSQFGHVTSVHIPVDDSKRNKGYAFITFQLKQDAKIAMDTMDGGDFQGRLIHILPARPSVDPANDIDESDLTYKERQALARQKDAEKSSKGWSASFLRGDAVVDNLSDRLGVSKGDVLNVKDGISSGNAAVRLALGETHIISENIAFFEEHGVDVTALESNSNTKKRGRNNGVPSPKRSKTMILVKNLPYDTSMEDLTKVFHDIGGDVPLKILLPPSKTAALVEYGHATDARRAFRRLAYKKFKHVPLYLEWAPMQEGGKQDTPTENTIKEPKQESSDTVVKQGLVNEDPSTETADIGVSQTIYIKNLNFSTSEDQLNKAFTKAGFHPRAVKIPTKSAPIKKRGKVSSTTPDSSSNTETRQVSMGFGFVEFPSEEEALKGMKALQGKLVEGHALEIKLSAKSLSSSSKAPTSTTEKSSKNTKIMIRNVPFEATRTELLQLFGSFGQLKKVRLPKKFDGTHRGFAFCEFVTSKEAQNAKTALSRTHLYGRHLVLEWAEAPEDDGNVVDVATVRERAKRDAMSAGFGGGKRSGKKGKHLKF